MHYTEKEAGSGFPFLKAAVFILIGIGAGFLITRLIILPARVTGNSMEPGLKEGETLLFLRPGSPEKGEVVLLNSPVEPDRVLIRRVIAVDGDTVEIKDRIIYINNKKFSPAWKVLKRDKRTFPLSFTRRDIMPPIKLQRGEYFVLADNFDRPFDSRYFGPVKDEMIRGTFMYKW